MFTHESAPPCDTRGAIPEKKLNLCINFCAFPQNSKPFLQAIFTRDRQPLLVRCE